MCMCYVMEDDGNRLLLVHDIGGALEVDQPGLWCRFVIYHFYF